MACKLVVLFLLGLFLHTLAGSCERHKLSIASAAVYESCVLGSCSDVCAEGFSALIYNIYECIGEQYSFVNITSPFIDSLVLQPCRTLFNCPASACQSNSSVTIMSPSHQAVFGGRFKIAGDTLAQQIAVWDQQRSWLTLGSGISGGIDDPTVYAIAANIRDLTETSVFAAGTFGFAGGVESTAIAYWVNPAWFNLAGNLFSPLSTIDVISYSPTNAELYIGGINLGAYGVTQYATARYSVRTQQWTPLGSLNGTLADLASGNFGRSLFVAGYVSTTLDFPPWNVATYDFNSSSWLPLGGSREGYDGINPQISYGSVSVSSLAAEKFSGGVYVGGRFTWVAGDLLVNNIAYFDGTEWYALGQGIGGSGPNLLVAAMALDESAGTLYVGGTFEFAGNLPANNVAKWDGQQWSALVGINGGNGVQCLGCSVNVVNAIARDWATGVVYFGGAFTKVGTEEASNAAAWFEAADEWLNLDTGVVDSSGDGAVYSICVGPSIVPTSNTPSPTFPSPIRTPAPATHGGGSLSTASFPAWIYAVIALVLVVMMAVGGYAFLRTRQRAAPPVSLPLFRTKTSKKSVMSGNSLRKYLLENIDDNNASEWIINIEDIDLAECVGQGAGSVVYQGSWHGVAVAVKTFHLASTNSYKECVAEYEMLSKLHHPNIIQLFGIVEFESMDRRLGIVMEYMGRGSLHQLIHSSSYFPYALVVDIARSISRAMFYLHSHQPAVLHRDLKPSNILLSNGNVAKVCDFGISRLKVENETMTFCGTPKWSAPEVIRGDRYSEAADVWSFGVILWEMVSREEPYIGLTGLRVVVDVASSTTTLLEMPPDTPADYSELTLACLQVDPSKRPSFAAIMERLSNFRPAV